MMTAAVVVLILALACVVFCHVIAKRRNLNPVYWAVMGAIFGPFAIPFVFFAKANSGENR